jgi:hypothetical protein
MSQLAIFETSDLATTNLSKLSEFLGSPNYRLDSEWAQVRAWSILGSTQLEIIYIKPDDSWSIAFHIFNDKTSYRKRLEKVNFQIAQAWLEANAKFIMENMSRGT